MIIPEPISKSEVAEYTAIEQQLIKCREKCADLKARNLKLEKENEVLRNCWNKAKKDIYELEKSNLLQARNVSGCEYVSVSTKAPTRAGNFPPKACLESGGIKTDGVPASVPHLFMASETLVPC